VWKICKKELNIICLSERFKFKKNVKFIDCIKIRFSTIKYFAMAFKAYQLTEDGQRRPVYYAEQSTAIAVGMLLAAIQNAGLCTVVTTPLNAGGAIREILQRPIYEKVYQFLMPDLSKFLYGFA
jgi:hypothetical protein